MTEGFKSYNAKVTEVILEQNGGISGKAYIDLDGDVRLAYIPSSAKSVRKDDVVRVHKNGVWIISEVITRHEPPVVNPTMGTKPPAASTTSGSTTVPSTTAQGWTRRTVQKPTRDLRQPTSHPSSYTTTWALSVNQAIADLRSSMYDVYDALQDTNTNFAAIDSNSDQHAGVINGLRSALSSLNTNLSSTQQTVNTNATRLNQAVDYASGAADAMGGVVQALRDERIVR